jgi:hypothetical protein
MLTTIAASVGTNQTANCWVAITPNGRCAYVTGDGSGPIHLALTDSGGFLYSLDSGTNTIGAFRIQSQPCHLSRDYPPGPMAWRLDCVGRGFA